jgi:uncharacterized membrane protein YgdD (TMEM256/DUF423 family)
MSSSGWLATGALAAGIGVGLGAFGAHGLKSRVDPQMLAVFDTGVRYHLYHALALLAVAWVSSRSMSVLPSAAGWAFIAGILLFSGSLYLLVLTGTKWLGAITPLGGLAFLLGWVLLAASAFARP